MDVKQMSIQYILNEKGYLYLGLLPLPLDIDDQRMLRFLIVHFRMLALCVAASVETGEAHI